MSKKDNFIEDKEFDFDFTLIFSFFRRNIIIIILFSFLGSLYGLYKAFSATKIWKGEFTLLISNEKKERSLGSKGESKALNLLGLNDIGANNGLNNDLEIIRSPTVLMPVFEYIKKEKNNLDVDTSSWKFSSWAKSVKLELLPKTTIIKASYEDNDKELIYPVLEKILNSYQNYSIRDRKREISQGLKYLEEQTVYFKERVRDSTSKLQSFGDENGLFIVGTDTRGGNPLINTEVRRNKLKQEIDKINATKEILSEINDKPNELITFVGTLEKSYEDDFPREAFSLLEKYNYYEQKSAIYENFYKENDPSQKKLQLQKKIIIEKLLKTINSAIDNSIINKTKIYNSDYRNPQVISKYRELFRDFLRDRATLDELDTQKRALSLESARSGTPWEVLTKPYVLEYPVYPRKLEVLINYFLISLLIGIAICFVLENRSGIIYQKGGILRFFDTNKIITLEKNNFFKSEIELNLLLKGILQGDKSKVIKIINLTEDDEKYIIKLEKIIKKNLKYENINISSKNINYQDGEDLYLLLINLGRVKQKDIMVLKESIDLINKKVSGLILIEKESEIKGLSIFNLRNYI